jgi:hypothetical protein
MASYSEREYAEAVRWIELAIQTHPRAPIRRAIMIACYARAGDQQRAAQERAVLDGFAPDFIASLFRGENRVFTRPEDMEHLQEGLRIAAGETARPPSAASPRMCEVPVFKHRHHASSKPGMAAHHAVRPFAACRDHRPPSTPSQRLKPTPGGRTVRPGIGRVEGQAVFAEPACLSRSEGLSERRPATLPWPDRDRAS